MERPNSESGSNKSQDSFDIYKEVSVFTDLKSKIQSVIRDYEAKLIISSKDKMLAKEGVNYQSLMELGRNNALAGRKFGVRQMVLVYNSGYAFKSAKLLDEQRYRADIECCKVLSKKTYQRYLKFHVDMKEYPMFVLLGGEMGMGKIVGIAKRFEVMIGEAENMSSKDDAWETVKELLHYFMNDIPTSILGNVKSI